MHKTIEVAHKLNLPEEKLLGDWIVCIPGFTLNKYRQLQQSNLSILSRNCFGGFISNLLALPFRSPFVNLFVSDVDFIKFLSKPHEYLRDNLIDKGRYFNRNANFDYPITMLGDISVHMMHYSTFKKCTEAWEIRKQRINWHNLIVVTITTSKEILEQFDGLPYNKKVSFVPFKSDLDSAYYIDYKVDKGATDFFHAVTSRFGHGHIFYYDIFDMLLYGKKTPLIDMG